MKWKKQGLLGVAVVIGVLCASYVSMKQIDELSGVESAPDARRMDMSSITDASPIYMDDGDEGIYAAANGRLRDNISLADCRVGDTMAGIRYIDDLKSLVQGNRINEIKGKLAHEQIKGLSGETSAERVIGQLVTQISSGKDVYVVNQQEVDGALLVRFMLMDMRLNVVCGRLYDYENAVTMTFTFFPYENDYLFVPFSIL